VRARKADRVRIVKMAAVRPAQQSPVAAKDGQSMKHDHVSLSHYLVLGAMLFAMRRRHLPQPQKRDRAADGHRADAAGGEYELRGVLALPRRPCRGQVFVFFILTVAAAEAAIGLAILVVLFRNRATINIADELDSLKG
jgi:hypothetical protein